MPILLSYIGPQVKKRQSRSYKFKEFTKISDFWVQKQILHTTHFLQLLDKMCKHEMDPTIIVEDLTDITPPQSPLHLSTSETSMPPFNFVEAEGIIT